MNPELGDRDPYWMAAAAIDESFRNCVAVGADPAKIAIRDNFCWGNPNLPDRLGALVLCARGCHDAAVTWKAPYISGKDSLNNEYTGADGAKHAIPGTLLVSALSIVPDVDATTTMDLKQAGHALVLVGMTADELGGSALYARHGEIGANVPRPRIDQRKAAKALHRAIRTGLVSACHDLSEGGLAVAVAESALAGQLGAEVDLSAVPFEGEGRDDVAVAFSESLTRWLVEVPVDRLMALKALLGNVPHARIGTVTPDPQVVFTGIGGGEVLRTPVDALRAAWRGHVG